MRPELLELLILVGIVAVAFGVIIAAMAVGVIFSNRRIQGSCGGLSTMRDADDKSPCMACGNSPTDCDDAKQMTCSETERVGSASH